MRNLQYFLEFPLGIFLVFPFLSSLSSAFHFWNACLLTLSSMEASLIRGRGEERRTQHCMLHSVSALLIKHQTTSDHPPPPSCAGPGWCKRSPFCTVMTCRLAYIGVTKTKAKRLCPSVRVHYQKIYHVTLAQSKRFNNVRLSISYLDWSVNVFIYFIFFMNIHTICKCVYTYVQKFAIGKIILCFWKSLMLNNLQLFDQICNYLIKNSKK